MKEIVICTSSITKVIIYARGARVIRKVELSEALKKQEVMLLIPNITSAAEVGSVQATVIGRDLIGIRSTLEVSKKGEVLGEVLIEFQNEKRKLKVLRAEKSHWEQKRQNFLHITPKIEITPKKRIFHIERRIEDALSTEDLIEQSLQICDDAIAKLLIEEEKLTRKVDSLHFKVNQTKYQNLIGDGFPTRNFELILGKGGPVESISFSYTIEMARWWPAYSIRIDDSAKKGILLMDAYIAQASMEDWTAIQCTLSTADMQKDVRLPELASWRIGKARPPKSKGYRPAPEGLEALFAGYDLTMNPSPQRPKKLQEKIKNKKILRSNSKKKVSRKRVRKPPSAPRQQSVQATSADIMPQVELGFTNFGQDDLGSPAPMMIQRSMGPPARAPMAKAKSSFVGAIAGAMAPQIQQHSKEENILQVQEQSITIGEDWQNFDGLQMAPITSSKRGRLHRKKKNLSFSEKKSLPTKQTIEALRPPKKALDPQIIRGMFDHIYHASFPVDVPSTATIHRVTLRSETLKLEQRARTVPIEEQSVFREIHAINPFGSPLLTGPLDVYMSGNLITTDLLRAVDKGGKFTFGLGIEDRIRVARNVHVRENSVGMFNTSTEVIHQISIELASALGVPFEVDVVERISITEDDDLKIILRETEPKAEKYDQGERGNPVLGGYKWSLRIPPGGKTKATLTYSMIFSSKFEIEGGNQRG